MIVDHYESFFGILKKICWTRSWQMMATWLGNMKDLPVWKPCAILVPPSLAFIYSISSAIFVSSWRECPWSQHLHTAVPRISSLVAFVAATVALTDDNNGVFAFLVTLSGSLSWYLMVQTRIHVIDGGPPPQLSTMKGQTVLITGANTGIGKETAHQLAEKGATVIMACRSLNKAEQAKNDIVHRIQIQNTSFEPKIELLQLDLSSLASVKKASQELKNRKLVVDVLILNAGVMMGKQSITDDGYDLVMQANHLGHYLLARLMLENGVIASENSRILNVTSSTYSYAEKIDLEDLFCTKGRQYTLFGQYSQSKLANILFTKELNKRFPKVFSAAVHPGLVRTDVVRNMPWFLYYPNYIFSFVMCLLQKTPAQGAWCTTFLAASPLKELESGAYWVNRQTQKLWPCANQGSEELWNDSAKYVGLKP